MRKSVRRAATLVAVPALVSIALVGASGPADAATDPAPTAAGAPWLAGQLTDGLFTYDFGGFPYTDIGSSIDAGLAFHDLGVQVAAVNDIVDAVAGKVGTYTRPSESDPSKSTDISAGATAKVLVLALATGSGTDSFGGTNLVTQLEGRVAGTAPNDGRIEDSWHDDGSGFAGDYANVVGQALAVRALNGVSSTKTASATDFLLAQQCTAGFFRESFSDVGDTDQHCDDATSEPSVDATAQAVLGLASQAADTDVAASIAKAGDWLVGFQNADGSFDSGTGDFAFPSNGNSTGLAARALAVAGDDAAAAKAATWLRAHQAANVGACAPYAAADLGAIAYDDTGRDAANGTPIDSADVGEWIRTTVQALPAIALAPAASGSLTLTAPTGFVHGGTKQTLRLSGLTPGAPACLTGNGAAVALTGAAGTVTHQVTLPKATGNRVLTLTTPGGTTTATVKVLGAKTLKPAVGKKRIHRGGRETVRVTGLAPGESVTVLVNGKRVVSGKASASGVFSRAFKVTGKAGKRTVTVKGQFADRAGRTTFTVVR